MPSEEQLANDFDANMYGPTQNIRVGQKLPAYPTARIISHITFLIRKGGSPSGDVDFRIYRESDKALLIDDYVMDVSALTTVAQWIEKELSTPISTEGVSVIIMVCYSGGNSSNYLRCRERSADVKAGENDNRFGTVWENNPTVDCAYKYTYTEPVAGGGGGPGVLVQAGVI